MVARTTAEPQGRPNKFTDVGVVGRKTGLMVKDTGRRDSAGLEDMDAFFSPAVEKSPRKGRLSPAGKLSYKTKFQAAIQSDSSVPMSGTSSSIRDPAEVLASRKSLLTQHRTPTKTFLKSPAVRVQTPKQSKLDSPSRVKRMLAFTELDTDFDDENLNTGIANDDDIIESPTEAARPNRKKGLAQKLNQKAVDLAEEEEEEEAAEEEQYHDDGFGDDYGAGFGDDSFDQEERVEETPEVQDDNPEDVEHAEEEEEEDLYGHKPAVAPVRRGKGAKASSQKSTKKSSGQQRKQSPPVRPAPKRARASAAPASPKIIQRREVPSQGDISMMDGDEVRRSTRIRVAPLAHWKGERIVYELEGRRASGPALPKIKEIVRIDTPPQPPRHSRPPPRKRKAHEDSDSEDGDNQSDAGEVYASIKAYPDDDIIIDDYRIAVSKSAINPQPLQGSKIRFEKLFQDGGYMASGIMDILVGGAKAVKPTRHSYMSFAVMTGTVEVKVHRTAFVISKGGVFVVPRGNFYSIKNVGQKDCRLFFSQAVEEGAPPTEQKSENN